MTNVPLSAWTAQDTESIFTLPQTHHTFLRFCVFRFALCTVLTGIVSLLRHTPMAVLQAAAEIGGDGSYRRTITERDRLG